MTEVQLPERYLPDHPTDHRQLLWQIECLEISEAKEVITTKVKSSFIVNGIAKTYQILIENMIHVTIHVRPCY